MSAFDFRDLDARTRDLMLEEIEDDVVHERLYLSKRFTQAGAAVYPGLLRQAASNGDELMLGNALRQAGAFAATELSRSKTGKIFEKAVPVTAAETFAEGEFNRFYVRALCNRALQEGDGFVTAYRAKPVENARSESAGKIGQRFAAQQLLDDLRANPGVDLALGLPSGPNSGLSVHL